MNSKERVHAALARKTTDRIPIFMWYHPDTVKRLSHYLEVPENTINEVMFNDVYQVWVGNNYAMEGISLEEGNTNLDFWGIDWIKRGAFNQVQYYPLENAEPDEIDRYEFPCEKVNQLIDNLHLIEVKSPEYFIGCDISPCFFEMYCRVRGMENALLDILICPETFKRFMEKSGDFAYMLAKAACKRFKLDWLWTGDDVGGQTAMMMDMQSWRENIKPYLDRLVQYGKSRGLWVAYHSCGSVRDIIPDLVEMGLDVLNPIQPNCPGMDPIELKREFGKKLAFMGGIDTQDLIPRGTLEDIKREVTRLVDIMSDGGGYILAASHTIPPETPMDNIFAMYDVVGVSKEMILDKASDVRK